jgi:hypothetical protein
MSGAATRTHANHALAVPDISRRARISVVRMRGDSSSTSTSPPSASGADPGELDRDRREVDAESEHSLSGELVQMQPRAIVDVEHRAVQRVQDARVGRIGRTDGALDGQRQHGFRRRAGPALPSRTARLGAGRRRRGSAAASCYSRDARGEAGPRRLARPRSCPRRAAAAARAPGDRAGRVGSAARRASSRHSSEPGERSSACPAPGPGLRRLTPSAAG